MLLFYLTPKKETVFSLLIIQNKSLRHTESSSLYLWLFVLLLLLSLFKWLIFHCVNYFWLIDILPITWLQMRWYKAPWRNNILDWDAKLYSLLSHSLIVTNYPQRKTFLCPENLIWFCWQIITLISNMLTNISQNIDLSRVAEKHCNLWVYRQINL